MQKLANANLHGLPKTQIQREHIGAMVRGRLDVRKSVKPYYSTQQVVSHYRDKIIDDTIAQILFQAFNIIKNNFLLGMMNIPDSAQEAINQIYSQVKHEKHLSDADYHEIRYKEIYYSWKPLVDFSWDLIKRRQISLKQNSIKQGLGFFIDMAEVWEQYLRGLLKKNFYPLGWRLNKVPFVAYLNNFFRRSLIPDLVFEKQNQFIIWDAKYKRMAGRPFDLDRSDFFQIHTYIQHFLKDRDVKIGGLLYPLISPFHRKWGFSPYLLNEDGFKTVFHVDGIAIDEISNTDTVELDQQLEKEKEFIEHILTLVQGMDTSYIAPQSILMN